MCFEARSKLAVNQAPELAVGWEIGALDGWGDATGTLHGTGSKRGDTISSGKRTKVPCSLW